MAARMESGMRWINDKTGNNYDLSSQNAEYGTASKLSLRAFVVSKLRRSFKKCQFNDICTISFLI